MSSKNRFPMSLTVSLIILAIVSVTLAQYSGGSGMVDDPYQIATAADLIALGETPEDYDKHFILTADIDLDPNLPGREVFDMAVIAPDTDPTLHEGGYNPFDGPVFAGLFDGNSHTISHLTITGGIYLGLFGKLDPSASVSNLALEAVRVNGTGARPTRSVGGLVGWNYGSITNSYSTGTVNGNDDVGGLVGGQALCSVTTSSFWDVETSGQTESPWWGIGMNTAKMQTAATFLNAGWDFVGETANGTEDIWWIDEGVDYPSLWWEPRD